jgi:hypothetical protein
LIFFAENTLKNTSKFACQAPEPPNSLITKEINLA